MGVSVVLAVIVGGMAGSLRHTVGAAPVLAALLWAAYVLRTRDVMIIGLGATLVQDLMTGVGWFTLVRLAAVISVIGVIRLARVRWSPTGTARGPQAVGSFPSVLLGLGLASPVYHLVLATGDWVTQFCTQAPQTLSGLAVTLRSAFPYFQRSFLSEVLFTAAFLGVYALSGSAVRLWWPAAFPQPISTK